MNVATIKYYDVANGPGVRVSLYVSGCRNRCKGCFNKETWDFNYGRPFTEEDEDAILKGMEPDYIKGFSLLGGDPFEPENQSALVEFMERLKAAYPDKTVWAYTGYDFERDLLTGKKGDIDVTMRLLKCIDVLVDGRFVEELKNPNLLFRGSSNQRIILVRQSLERDEVVKLVAFTPRLYIRAFNLCDEAALFDILGDRDTMKYVEPPFDRKRTAEWLKGFCMAEGNAYAVEHRESGKLVGYVMCKPAGADRRELGWIFRRDCLRQGYAFEAVSAVIDHVFTELGVFEVTASAVECNEASIALMRKLGMKFTGSEKEGQTLLMSYAKNKGNK